jgi:hypothetical protein
MTNQDLVNTRQTSINKRQTNINDDQVDTNDKQTEINDSTKFSFNAKEIVGFIILLSGILGSWFSLSAKQEIIKQAEISNNRLVLQKLDAINTNLTTHIVNGDRLEDQMRAKVIDNDRINNEQDKQIAGIAAFLKIK